MRVNHTVRAAAIAAPGSLAVSSKMKTRMRTRGRGRAARVIRVRRKVRRGRGRGRKCSGSFSDDNSDSINSSSKSERQQGLRKSRWNLPPRGKPKNKQKTSGKSAPAAKEISLLNLEDFTPPNIQPVSPPRVVSSSLAADLQGLTQTLPPPCPHSRFQYWVLGGRSCYTF